MELLPDPGRIIEGLRDTGYDFNTAIADLIDNSIAANATEIDLKLDVDPSGQIRLYLADNGCGMNRDGLRNAMRYGAQARKDPSSLGKFGLGLKTASTAFCRQLSLVSRGDAGECHKVVWDIDHVIAVNQWDLIETEPKSDEIFLLDRTAKKGTGTLVIWEKVDRLMKTYQKKGAQKNAFVKLVDSLRFHISMVFQRFLDVEYKGVHHTRIRVNDVEVRPWDPFFRSEEKTKMLATEDIPVEYSDGVKSSFKVTAWLLPRVEQFSSPEAKKDARISNDMEGIYVYRENRLIHHGDWLRMFTNDPHISLLRVDFSFDHSLDAAFNVDIKKSRIQLIEEIYDYVKTQFLQAPKRTAENLYRKAEVEEVMSDTQKSGAHNFSNQNIESKASSLQAATVTVVNPETNSVTIENNNGKFDGVIRIRKSSKPGECRVVPTTDIECGILWEPTIVDGKHAVGINVAHPFYSKVYAPNISNPALVAGIDGLLWSLAEAEFATYSDEVKDYYEEMRIEVSRIIKKLVATLADPQTGAQEE